MRGCALQKHVLLIDDCQNISKLLSVVIERFFTHDLRLSNAHRLEDGLKILADDYPDAILLDYSLQPSHGCAESVEALRAAGYSGPLHLWSNQDSRTLKNDPATKAAVNVFQKHDYAGLKLKQLLREYFCEPLHTPMPPPAGIGLPYGGLTA